MAGVGRFVSGSSWRPRGVESGEREFLSLTLRLDDALVFEQFYEGHTIFWIYHFEDAMSHFFHTHGARIVEFDFNELRVYEQKHDLAQIDSGYFRSYPDLVKRLPFVPRHLPQLLLCKPYKQISVSQSPDEI